MASFKAKFPALQELSATKVLHAECLQKKVSFCAYARQTGGNCCAFGESEFVLTAFL